MSNILSDERIKAFLDDLLCCQYAGKEIDKLYALLDEAELIIRKDEKKRIADWLEEQGSIVSIPMFSPSYGSTDGLLFPCDIAKQPRDRE